MPTRKKPTAAEEAAASLEAAPEVIEPAPVQPQDPDAVVVLKTTDGEGGVGTEIQILGNVQPTEVQTLLELGVRRWRTQIGLDKSN